MKCNKCKGKLNIEYERGTLKIKCPTCAYEKQYEFGVPIHTEIQILQETSLYEYVKNYCSWNVFVGSNCPDWELLNKYGYEIGGAGMGWAWNENLKEATEEELYKIIALCKMSWANKDRDDFLFGLKWSSDESDKELYKEIKNVYG